MDANAGAERKRRARARIVTVYESWGKTVEATIATRLRDPDGSSHGATSDGPAVRALKEQLTIASARNTKMLREMRARGERIDALSQQLAASDGGDSGHSGSADLDQHSEPSAKAS